MALETATYVNQLVATNPPSSDPMSQGDDHIRLVKSTTLNSFPNVGGAVTASHTQLNVLATMTYPLVAADLAANSVTTVKILDQNVTTAKIADANVTTVKILDANVTTAKILDANVTTSKLLDGAVTAAKIAPMTNARLLGNNSGGAASPQEISVGSGLLLSGTVLSNPRTLPTYQIFSTGAANYTTPANVTYIKVRFTGSGGAGTAGGNGNATTFNAIGAAGGLQGASHSGTAGGAGGAGGTGGAGAATLRIAGQAGRAGQTVGQGGTAFAGRGGSGGINLFGGSGASGSDSGTLNAGGDGGGGSGEYAELLIAPTAAQVFAYSVGAAVGGSSTGRIIVEEFYN